MFVHGMFGNSDDTWRFSSQVYWPEMLLSDTTFNDSDIYVASYPTPFVGGRMNIEDIVSNLENRLTADDVFSKHREVVFVCHSLGGLVVERLLLKNRDYDKQVPFIYFFGTPQTGADIASIGKLLDDPLFKDLSASQDNEILQGIEDEWRAAHVKIRSYCAYERKTILGQLVVDRLSATRNCTEPPVAIDETHIGLVKPNGTGHDSYIALKNAVTSNPIGGMPSPKGNRGSAIPPIVQPTGIREKGLTLANEITDFLNERQSHDPAPDQIYLKETRQLFTDKFGPRVANIHDEFVSRGLRDSDLDELYDIIPSINGNVNIPIAQVANSIKKLSSILPPRRNVQGHLIFAAR